MATTVYTHNTSSAQTTRGYDGWIMTGYCVLGAIALAAIYFAAGGPGNDGTALAVMAAMP